MATNTNTDWRTMKTGSECLKSLLLSETLCDVVFTFKQPGARRLPAHRFVLAMRSPVFEAMFYGPMKDNKTEILLEDDTPEAFELLLRYMYTDDVCLKRETVLSCLYTAKKYCIDGLIKTCSDYLEHSISKSNASTLYEQAKFFEMDDLKSRCLAYITDNSDDVFASEEFLSISQDTLTTILADDNLQSVEKDIFAAAIKWASNQCAKANIESTSVNLRNYMGDAIYQIRFPLIQIDVFARTVTPVGVLTDNEQVMLYQYIATKDTQTLKQVGKFSSAERNAGKVTVPLDICRNNSYLFGNRFDFQICPSQDILLYEIKCPKNIVNIKSVRVKCRTATNFALGYSAPVDIGIVDCKVVNGSIIFEKPISLKKSQTTFLNASDLLLTSCNCDKNMNWNLNNVTVSARITSCPVEAKTVVIKVK